MLGTLVFGQKNNQSSQLASKAIQNGLGTNSVSETVPRRLSYQGLLTKTNGRAVTDGTYQVTFRLYRELEGGTAFWEETQSIGIEDGIVSATLGSSVPINSIPSDAYLEIDIDGTALSPRQEMTSVFYSVVSDTAKYAEAGSYLNLDDLPDLSGYATKDTLTAFVQSSSLDSVAFTGSYNDLEDLPDLSEILELDTLGYYLMSDSLALYTLTTDLASVALSNDYNELTNLPDLTQYAVLDTLGSYVSSDTLSNFVHNDSLGTIADQNADNVAITGGSVIGITDVAIADGGTGASDNSTARSNLGLEIGVDIQAFDADLADLADGSLSAEKVEYLDNVTSDIQAQIDAIGDGPVNSLEDLGVTADSTELNYVDGVTSNIQDQLDAKQDLNANLTTLAGLEHNHDHFIVSDGVNWTIKAGADARGSLGLGSIATQEADNVAITGGSITSITDIAIADGGTGASDITTARENLGLEIGVDVQGYDADLTDLSDGTLTASKVQYLENVTSDVQAQLDSKGTGNVSTLADLGVTSDATEVNYTDGVTSNIQVQLDSKMDNNAELTTISGLAHSDGNIIVSDGSGWTVESGAVARTSLGLGSIATQAADNVSITGGSVSGITDLAIADGGTNASDVSEARSNLGLEIGVDVQAYDADLADLADGKLTATKVQHGEYFITADGTNGQVWTSDGDGAGAWGDVAGITGAATTIDTEDLAASRAIISNTDGKIAASDVTTTELGHMDGVTSNVQTQLDSKQDKDDHLSDIADLNHADGNFIVSNGAKWVIENGSDARTSLGLGTIATQAADNVTITGGSVTGITDITVADGGTGASDVATARSNLGLEIGVDVQAYDADLADLADGTLSASKVENNEFFITSAGTNGQIWTSDGDGAGGWGDNTAATNINGLTDALVEDTGSMYVGNDPSSTTDAADYNLAVGVTALDAVTTGDYNTALGYSSLTDNTTGTSNAAYGSQSLFKNTTGNRNTAFGHQSMHQNTEGSHNTAVGYLTLKNTTANSNTAVGNLAMTENISGVDNVALGMSALRNSTASNYNTAIGKRALYDANRTADSDGYNIAVGYAAGYTGTNNITTGNKNTLLGASTAAASAAATNQTVIGYGASGQADNSVTLGNADVTAVYMSQDKGATVYAAALGFGSTAMTLPTADGSANQLLKTDGNGTLAWTSASSLTSINTLSDALIEDTGSMYVGNDPSSTTDGADYNLAVSTTALDAITTGDSNTAVGYDALTDNTEGNRNTAIGAYALKDNTTGIVNVAVGSTALDKNTTGNSNTAVGHSSAYSLTSGSSNVSMGWKSAFTVETGNNNVIIGAEANPSTDGGSTNQVVIGQGASGQADNSVTLGNADVTAVYMSQDKGATVYAAALGFGSTAMTLPTADGSANQLLKTDGNGTLAWTSASSLTSINTLSDALIEDTGSMYVGNDPSSTTDGADYNLAVGTTALDAITTGDQNTALGYDAMTANTTGSFNTAFGYKSLESNGSGNRNIAIGMQSLNANSSGHYNSAVGMYSLYANTTAAYNTAMGFNALKLANRTADTDGYNTALGYNAGTTGTNDITTGNKNTLLGASTAAASAAGTNQTVIGYGASGQADNSVTLGNADITAIYMAQDQGATVYAAGVDITGSSGLILENDETITNSTDGTILIDGKADFNDNAITGYGADLQTESGTSKTLAATDNGTIIVCSSNSAVTITVPASLPSGFNCMIIQNGSGQVSLSASSTTLNNRNGSKTAGQYAILTLVHLGSNVFVVSGDTSS